MSENSKEDDEVYYLSMQAQFGNVDLLPGVESSFSWLSDPQPAQPVTRIYQELDEMNKRWKEMEEEASALREMQAKVEKEMGVQDGCHNNGDVDDLDMPNG
ncbi:hypothetical protein Hanom_Chr03g00264621 [Helianthus anomalus]